MVDIQLIGKEQINIELIKTPILIKGESAYDLAVKNGFVGTELEWLDSLKADKIQWSSTNW